jgi:hypothetical protein
VDATERNESSPSFVCIDRGGEVVVVNEDVALLRPVVMMIEEEDD